MTGEWWLLGGLAVVLGVQHLTRSWRLTVGLLVLVYALVTALFAQQPFDDAFGDAGFGVNVLAQVEAVTAIVIIGLLVLTGRACAVHGEQADQPPPVAPSDARTRRIWSRLKQPRSWLGRQQAKRMLVGLTAGFVVVVTLAFAQYFVAALPVVGGQALRYAGALLLLNGLLQLVLAEHVLKWGGGLLLIVLGIQVLYLALSPNVSLLVFGLLSIAMIMLALVVACLGSIIFHRTHSLALAPTYGVATNDHGT